MTKEFENRVACAPEGGRTTGVAVLRVPHAQLRRGSALLVVLGMLAFMLFSGLAFSVYMRQSRLSTSFLRRTATTRQLTKAALAEAIDQIDRAIGNDPHPGVRVASRQYNENVIDNIWNHRVFFGLGTDTRKYQSDPGVSAQGKTVYPKYAADTAVVPTLTLEGLAYLPPNLINEARFYSQGTPTAKWHSFWFDSGRYAYTAIDVSDYFDVNRILADRPRAASGSRRVSLAYAFEQGADHSSAGSGAAQWDNFMARFRSVNQQTDAITYNTYPFVSMADFNIAWGSQTIGGLRCPFYDFINNMETGPYDCGETKEDANAEKYRGMTFVTDGWFPVSPKKTNGKVFSCDLGNPRYQPFKMDKLENDNLKPSIDDVALRFSYSDPSAMTWLKTTDGDLRLNMPNLAALWDYLDADSVPISLCVPTVERVPMICGISPKMEGDVKLTVKQEAGDDQPNKTKIPLDDGNKWDFYSREVTYALDASALIGAQKTVKVLLTYPFQEHGRSEYLDRNFTVDGRFSVFLSQADGGASVSIRSKKFSAYPKKGTISQAEITDQSVLSFPIRPQGLTPKSIINGSTKKEMPCMDFGLAVDSGAPQGSLVLAKVKYTWPRDKWTVDADGNEVKVPNVNKDPVLAGDAASLGYANTTVDAVTDIKFFPLKSDGSRYKDSEIADVLKKRQSFKLKANVAVWVRVKDDQNKTVDFVPACHLDDVNMNDGQESRCSSECGGGSYGYPLMRAAPRDIEDYSLANLHGGNLGTFAMPETKWVVSDPRYNFAPENWVLAGGDVAPGELEQKDWTENAQILAQIQNGDGDVFMSTSDEGFLQSMYELSFLPRVGDGFYGGGIGNLFMGNLSFKFDKADYPTTFAAAKDTDGSNNKQLMWRSYSPYEGDTDEFSELETIFVSGGGQKVNPYSDSTHVLMAAFANTPHDWRAASTNNDELFKMKASAFNKKYAWNGYSSDETGKLCWDCLEEFSEKFQDKVRDQTYAGNWEDAFADLGWSRDRRKIIDSMDALDGDDADLYSVDKKFLYGFWHDCFAARQQLFLIFVRAEPMMMGGGVQGQIPPQLGARAVALVWRDPTAATGTRSVDGQTVANPHRTRILFYHQFD